ncbi:MAG: hypothetical protein RBR48_01155 [Bacilli bacterium]|jgi:hypothetical protein|nr:hypothetical protein [Bacilli bacterium]MDD3348126.1 hypothetical protein [Bacilli bacterium]MDD4056079.1 hypothetical protein [Bacilli bacterium]MDY0208773.1 hypothetical protein [Bacilli bacterium]
MDKVKFGKTFYNVCLIICVVILLAAFLLFKTKDSSGNVLPEEQLIETWIYRYLVSFYMFTFLIPLAALVREYTSGAYVAKKMIMKMIIGVAALVIGSALIFILWDLRTAQLSMLGAMLSAVYILAPTTKTSTVVKK